MQPRAATILTIGNELVSGDVTNTNGSWLAGRLERLGIAVRLIAAVPDEIERIAAFIRQERAPVTCLLVTGGLGGTPDDLTREGVAAAFGVEQVELPELAAELRARFHRHPDYAARWAELPLGARPLVNPLGGAPGFALENVYVLPGLPEEMRAMWEAIEPEFAGAGEILSWRRSYRTSEAEIVALLEEAERRFPAVSVGSYPSFSPRPEVELVLKSPDAESLEAASSWLSEAVELRLS
ncbi:MAG: competence/damage-inducible protein A [Gaiellaceae bacterium]